jgi:transposase
MSIRRSRGAYGIWMFGVKRPSCISCPAVSNVVNIDEISLKKRHKQFVLVISDISRKCILEVLPDREKQTLEHWIESLKASERKAIQFVSIDMWRPYYQAVRGKLPHAEVVVDRFYVMKQLNTRLTQLANQISEAVRPRNKKSTKGQPLDHRTQPI